MEDKRNSYEGGTFLTQLAISYGVILQDHQSPQTQTKTFVKNDRHRREDTDIAPFLRRSPSALLDICHFLGSLEWGKITRYEDAPITITEGILRDWDMIQPKKKRTYRTVT